MNKPTTALKEKTRMNKLPTAMRLSLSALALGTGVAAQAQAPVITNITMVAPPLRVQPKRTIFLLASYLSS
jgi:hypothetical protein